MSALSSEVTKVNSSKQSLTASLECPVCFQLFSEVEPTTLPCGHSLCVTDAKDLKKCPICCEKISDGFNFSVNCTIQALAESISKELTISKDNDNLEDEEESGGQVMKGKGKKKNKHKNDSKKKARMLKQLAVAYERANYYCDSEAFDKLETLAIAGNDYAIGFLAICLFDNKRFNVILDQVVVNDSLERLMDLAKSNNDVYALYIIAWCGRARWEPSNAVDVPWPLDLSDAQTFQWFQRSYEGGFTLALCEVVWCYAAEVGVKKDVKTMMELHNKAVDAGHYISEHYLFKLFESENNIAVAKNFLNQARDDGIVRSIYAYALDNSCKEDMEMIAKKGYLPAMFHVLCVPNLSTDEKWKRMRKMILHGCKHSAEFCFKSMPQAQKLHPDEVLVFEAAAKMGIPKAVDLISGYRLLTGQIKPSSAIQVDYFVF